MIARELKDFEIVTALIAGQIISGYPRAPGTIDYNDVANATDSAEKIVLEVVRRNDERVD